MKKTPQPRKQGDTESASKTRPYRGDWTKLARYRPISLDEALQPELKAKVLALYAQPIFEP